MPKRKPRTAAPRPDLSRTALLAVRLAFFFAFGISAYLAWNSLQGGGVPGCGPESDCDKVLSSRWAYLFGLPVSLFALPIYLATLILLFQKTLQWKVILPLAVLVLGSALWFVGLQAFALRAFCKFCMTAHAVGGIAALVLLRNNPLPAALSSKLVGLAAAPIALLAIAQLSSSAPGPVQVSSNAPIPASPKAPGTVTSNLPTTVASNLSSAVSSTSSNGSSASLAVIDGVPDSIALPPPTFTFIDGDFTVNLKKVPVSGPLDAPKKMVKLFDYTCHHCRDLHHLLKPVKKRFASELAVISLPVPLDANCNSVVRRTAAAHVNACEYARAALAVFLVQPEKFEEFSDWLFGPDRPPALDATYAQAESLVGKEAFAAALKDPRVEEQIRMDVNVYLASSQKAKRGVMPQLLFSRGGSIGAISTAAQLESILKENLGL